MSETKYVIQLEHQQPIVEGQSATTLIYNIKDKEIREKFDEYLTKMEQFRGIAGHSDNSQGSTTITYDYDGYINDTWINDVEEAPYGFYGVNGFYGEATVGIEALDSLWDAIEIPSSESTEESSETNETSGESSENSSESSETTETTIQVASYINKSLYTYSDEINFPAILILGPASTDTSVTRTVSMVDSTGLIWKRIINNGEYCWINLFDDKANISDFRVLASEVKQHSAQLESLQLELAYLLARIAGLEAVNEYTADPQTAINGTGVFNVLILGDNTNYNDRTNLADTIQKELNLNGTVVWTKNKLTKNASEHIGTYTYDGIDYAITLKPTTGSIWFSGNKVNGQTVTELKITDFNMIIILANKEDIYTTDPTIGYGYIQNGKITDMLGNSLPGDAINIKTTGADVNYVDKAGTIHTTAPTNIKDGIGAWGDAQYDHAVPTKVYITYEYNTFSAYASEIISQIQKLNSDIIVRYASPITWEKTSTTALTSSVRDTISTFETKIKQICAAAGVKYYETRQIGSVERKNSLDNNGKVTNNTAINNYLEDLCKIITDSLPVGTKFTINILDDKLRKITHSQKLTEKTGSNYKFKNGTTTNSTSYYFTAPDSGSGTFTYIAYLTTKITSSAACSPNSGLYLYRYNLTNQTRGDLIGQKWMNQAGSSGNLTLLNSNNEQISSITWDTGEAFELRFVTKTEWNNSSFYGQQDTLYSATYTYDWEVDFTDTST